MLLCWLALLLVRVVEVKSGQTWATVRAELDQLHSVTLEGTSGRVAHRTELTDFQKKVFADLGVDPPSRIRRIETAEPKA